MYGLSLGSSSTIEGDVAKGPPFATRLGTEIMAATTINPDTFLQTEVGRVWTPERNAEAWRRSFEALDAALERGEASRVIVVCGLQGAGKSTWIDRQPDAKAAIYFDAALPGARHRKPIIEIARRHRAKIQAVWINVPLSVALERNALRPLDQVVPEESIRSVASRFEPPSAEEGFEAVTVVGIQPDDVRKGSPSHHVRDAERIIALPVAKRRR